MAVLETRKKLVDEVQLKTNVIVNVLQDVRVNLEMLWVSNVRSSITWLRAWRGSMRPSRARRPR